MLKQFRPITAGQRHLILGTHDELTRVGKNKRATVKPEKRLLVKKQRINGRNHHGHITCRHRGGGVKRFYRLVDFKRDKEKVQAVVASIEYDPNRTAHIALLNFVDGEKRYIIAPQGLKAGDVVMTDDEGPFNTGCCMRLKSMPLGSVIHNIEIEAGPWRTIGPIRWAFRSAYGEK